MTTSSLVQLRPKFLGETAYIPQSGWDFSGQLQPSETLVTAACFSTVYSGNDANPQTVVSGAASIINSNTGALQLFAGGVLGTIYLIVCKVTTSLGQTLEQAGYLAVIPDSSDA